MPREGARLTYLVAAVRSKPQTPDDTSFAPQSTYLHEKRHTTAYRPRPAERHRVS